MFMDKSFSYVFVYDADTGGPVDVFAVVVDEHADYLSRMIDDESAHSLQDLLQVQARHHVMVRPYLALVVRHDAQIEEADSARELGAEAQLLTLGPAGGHGQGAEFLLEVVGGRLV